MSDRVALCNFAFVRTGSRRLAASLLFLALLAAPSVFAASAKGAPSELLVHFVMPGRDIECLMVDPNVRYGNVECGIHRNRFRGSRSGFDSEKPSRRWLVNVHQFAVVEVSTRPFGSSPVRVLRYGQTLRVGYFRCTSRVAGLTYLSRESGHGFMEPSNTKSPAPQSHTSTCGKTELNVRSTMATMPSCMS